MIPKLWAFCHCVYWNLDLKSIQIEDLTHKPGRRVVSAFRPLGAAIVGRRSYLLPRPLGSALSAIEVLRTLALESAILGRRYAQGQGA